MVTPSARPDVRAGTAEAGFSMLELLVATAISVTVLGVTVTLSTQMQEQYSFELEAGAVRSEAQFALDWIVRDLRATGANPYDVTVSACPANGTAFQAIRLDPNGNGLQDDIRIQSDINPPNGLLGGGAGACTEAGEDITIAHDPANRVVTRRDNNINAAALPMTDDVITGLTFTFLDATRAPAPGDTAVAFIGVAVTARTRVRSPNTRQFVDVTVQDELRVRMR